MKREETIVSQSTVFNGKIFSVDRMEITLPNGRPALREVVRNPGASAVVVNDTTAVLLSGLVSGADGAGLIGLINGTGTNVCCQADVGGRKMIVDVESGGFIPPQRSEIDAALDAATAVPGVSMEEKLVSGAYLGERCRRAFRARCDSKPGDFEYPHAP